MYSKSANIAMYANMAITDRQGFVAYTYMYVQHPAGCLYRKIESTATYTIYINLSHCIT